MLAVCSKCGGVSLVDCHFNFLFQVCIVKNLFHSTRQPSIYNRAVRKLIATINWYIAIYNVHNNLIKTNSALLPLHSVIAQLHSAFI